MGQLYTEGQEGGKGRRKEKRQEKGKTCASPQLTCVSEAGQGVTLTSVPGASPCISCLWHIFRAFLAPPGVGSSREARPQALQPVSHFLVARKPGTEDSTPCHLESLASGTRHTFWTPFIHLFILVKHDVHEVCHLNLFLIVWWH